MKQISVCSGAAGKKQLVAVRWYFMGALKKYPCHVQSRCSEEAARGNIVHQSFEAMKGLPTAQYDYTVSFGSRLDPCAEGTEMHLAVLIKGPFQVYSFAKGHIFVPKLENWQKADPREPTGCSIPTRLYDETIARAMIPYATHIDYLAGLL